MATEYVKSVGTGKDYSTLAAWHAANGGLASKDLVSQDVIAVAEVYTGEDTSPVTVSGWTTDATRKIIVRPAAGYEHGGKWNDGVYRLKTTSSTCLTVSQQYSDVYGLQMDVASASSTIRGWTGTVNNTRAINCIARGTNGTGSTQAGYRGAATTNCRTIGCIAYDFDNATSYGFLFPANGATPYNCTAYNCTNGFSGIGTANVAKNCMAMACGAGFVGTWSASSDSNASNTADAPGTNALSGAVLFENTGAYDFHLAAGDTVARGTGGDLAADFAALGIPLYDLDGQAVTTWSRGADIQAGAAGGTTQDASHVASGGSVSGGSADSSREASAQGSGGSTSGGAAPTSREVLSTGSGGASTGGAAQASKEAGHVASGGAVSGGAAEASTGEATQDASHTGSGGAVSGGAAASSRESVTAGQGGAVSSGQSSQSRESTATGSGGAVSGGAAVASASTAGDSEDVGESVVFGEFVSDITIEVAGMLWVEHVVPGSIH